MDLHTILGLAGGSVLGFVVARVTTWALGGSSGSSAPSTSASEHPYRSAAPAADSAPPEPSEPEPPTRVSPWQGGRDIRCPWCDQSWHLTAAKICHCTKHASVAEPHFHILCDDRSERERANGKTRETGCEAPFILLAKPKMSASTNPFAAAAFDIESKEEKRP